MKERYTVYQHVDPSNSETVYVGMGTLDRPWQVRNRTPEHTEWLIDKYNLYGTLAAVVLISKYKILKEDASELELKLISEKRPIFNKNYDYPIVALTKENFELAMALREDGLSYANIAKELETSSMTIYRALNGKTKAYDKY